MIIDDEWRRRMISFVFYNDFRNDIGGFSDDIQNIWIFDQLFLLHYLGQNILLHLLCIVDL